MYQITIIDVHNKRDTALLNAPPPDTVLIAIFARPDADDPFPDALYTDTSFVKTGTLAADGSPIYRQAVEGEPLTVSLTEALTVVR